MKPDGASFESCFGRKPTGSASAPGRVNLIGEHTDYNDGFVLPTAIPQRTYAELALRDDQEVHVASASFGDAVASYTLGSELPGVTPESGWLRYVAGVTWVLRKEGRRLPGFDLRIASDVPVGSGVSSSAALSVAVLRLLRSALKLDIDDTALPNLAWRSEHQFVGVPVGLMDPMACHLCEDNRVALFLDIHTLRFERIPIPESAEIVVINSGITHSHESGEYRVRREECERAGAALRVASLRHLSLDDVPRVMRLPEPLGRRARHVITENERVLLTAKALREGDLATAGDLFEASHASMRDDFEVSVPGIDLLVRIANEAPGVFGSRMTGGGFGGSIVALVERGRGHAVAEAVVGAYTSSTASKSRPQVLVPLLR